MDRRHFAQLSALALAGARVPAPAQVRAESGGDGGRRLGIAPVGLGSIAEVFMRAVGQTANARLTGLVTGPPAETGG